MPQGARLSSPDAELIMEDEHDSPITAGLLSLFLPGTGQLLNGHTIRASCVFAVWASAWILHVTMLWTAVGVVAGVEAAFSAWRRRRAHARASALTR